MAHLARPLWEYAQVSSPETVCLFHFSIGSAARRLIYHAPDRLVVHLPQHHARRLLPGLPSAPGRPLLPRPPRAAAFAPRTELALGDSEFNRRELEAAGFARTAVLPIVLDLAPYRRPPSPVSRRLYADGRVNLLFVGRIIPNKRIDDLIRVFALYQRHLRAAQPAAAGGRLPRPRALLRPPAGDGAASCAWTRWCSPGTWTTTTCAPTTRRPTCSSASPSTRASACRCWRPWSSACPWWPTTRARWRRPCAAAGVLLADKRPGVGGRAACTRCSPTSALRRPRAGGARRARWTRCAPPTSARCSWTAWLPCCRGAPTHRAGAGMRVDQWVPALHRGDAIGDSARLMRDAFRRWGTPADVYALELDDDLAGDGRPFAEWRPGGAGRRRHPALRAALAPHRRPARAPRPARAAAPQHHAARVLRGLRRRDGAHLRAGPRGAAAACAATWTWPWPTASSTGASWRPPASPARACCPSTSTSTATARRPTPCCDRLLGDGRTNLLFVGRVAPNKRQDDLIRLAAYWKRFIWPGRAPAAGGQAAAAPPLLRRAAGPALREGFTPWEVVFTGHVDHGELLACYAAAHVFVSMSEHEGFGVPAGGGHAHARAGAGLSQHGGAAHAGRRRRAVRREAPRRGGGDGARCWPTEARCARRCWPARSGGCRPSRPRRWRRRCAATWTRCERSPRWPSSSSATAPTSPAGRSRWPARWPSAWPRTTRSRSSPPAPATTSPGATSCRPGEETLDGVRGACASRWRRSATSTPSTASRRRSTAGRTPRGRGARGCAGRGRTCRRWWRRCAERRGALRAPSSSSPTSTTRRAWGCRRRPSAPCWCPPPTTSRRCASRSTARCSRCRAPSPSSPARGGAGARALRPGRPAGRRGRHRRRRAGGARRGRLPHAPRPARAPYVLYAGRIDAGKGCAEMLGLLRPLPRDSRAQPLPLLLIGAPGHAGAAGVPGVRYLGYLAEEEKAAAMAGARAVVCPSPYESLSIVLLEGFAAGVPALVERAARPVLMDHCRRSNGRALLRRRATSSRSPGPAAAGRRAAPGPGARRPPLRGPELPLAGGHGALPEADRARSAHVRQTGTMT